ncbi:MAG: hypothetical protein RLZZ416_411 [Candidatus Parcubacteria bacterium]|jgi:hypothetical protein
MAHWRITAVVILSFLASAIFAFASAPAAPPLPLTATCNAAGTQATLNWTPVAGADHYWLRVNDYLTPDCSSPTVTGPNGYCTSGVDYVNDVAQPGVTVNVPTDRNLVWWVHSVSSTGEYSEQTTFDFTCYPPQPAAPPALSISASPATIGAGQSSTISWSASNYYSCTIGVFPAPNYTIFNYSPPWSGSNTTGPLSTNKTYTLSCLDTNNQYSYSSSTVVTVIPAPTCAVTISPTSYNAPASATLSWSSSNAASFYINSVGYVGASGSTTVSPSASTDYSGTVTGPGGSATCPATLTVHPSCTFNGQTVTHGSSVTAYQAATVPYGSSCASQVRTCTEGTLSESYQYPSCAVSPPANCTLDGATVLHGQSRTFYSKQTAPVGQLCSALGQSRTCTDGSLSGSPSYQYASCSCTPSAAYSCSASNIIQTSTDASCTVTANPSYATCVSPQFCSPGSSACLDAAITVSQHLAVRPQLVQQGSSAKVYWQVSNASHCSVTGSNGDAWNFAASGEAGVATSPINQQTTYTLACTAFNGSHINESQVVNVVPAFQEI